MQALLLMGVYLMTVISTQFVGFLISRLVDLQYPSMSLMIFLVLFIAAFAIAWPIALFMTEWLIVRSGRKVEIADPRAV